MSNDNIPSTINKYNQFLINMDKNIIENMKVNKIIKDMKINNKEDLDLALQIFKSIIMNDKLYLPGITGQSDNDIISSNIKITNPNFYLDDKIDGFRKRNKKQIPTIILEPDKEIEIEKTLVNINVEINNISDILSLIEKYQIEPNTKYNINMQTLHNIKEPLIELNNMIGMKELKINIVDQILYFIQDLHKSKDDSGDFMHTVIYGPPGTGKTEVAKIMGKIYSKIGVLTKGTFKKVTRNDLIAGFLGQTAIKTKDVIKEAIGGVLFIDEAYSLGNSEKKDSFSKECIDTLCEALSDNKNDLMVIIAGYETELNECFFNYNTGLDSRFTWRFNIDNYSAEDLYNIFIKKVKDIEWSLHTEGNINSDWFKTKMVYLKFFGRDIETILAKTKISHSKRVFCKPEDEKKIITLQDLNKGFELYLKNNDVKNRKDVEQNTKRFHSIYI